MFLSNVLQHQVVIRYRSTIMRYTTGNLPMLQLDLVQLAIDSIQRDLRETPSLHSDDHPVPSIGSCSHQFYPNKSGGLKMHYHCLGRLKQRVRCNCLDSSILLLNFNLKSVRSRSTARQGSTGVNNLTHFYYFSPQGFRNHAKPAQG